MNKKEDIIKAIEALRGIAAKSTSVAYSLEILAEEDIDPDYEKDTAIAEEVTAADIEVQDRERTEAYKVEMNIITTDELKTKAAEAAHTGQSGAIKARFTELGVRKISELPEQEFSELPRFH